MACWRPDGTTRHHDRTMRQHDTTTKPSRHNDTPTRQNDTPTRQNDTPSRHNDTPTRQNDTPSRQNDTPTRHTIVLVAFRSVVVSWWRGDTSSECRPVDLATLIIVFLSFYSPLWKSNNELLARSIHDVNFPTLLKERGSESPPHPTHTSNRMHVIRKLVGAGGGEGIYCKLLVLVYWGRPLRHYWY